MYSSLPRAVHLHRIIHLIKLRVLLLKRFIFFCSETPCLITTGHYRSNLTFIYQISVHKHLSPFFLSELVLSTLEHIRFLFLIIPSLILSDYSLHIFTLYLLVRSQGTQILYSANLHKPSVSNAKFLPRLLCLVLFWFTYSLVFFDSLYNSRNVSFTFAFCILAVMTVPPA